MFTATKVHCSVKFIRNIKAIKNCVWKNRPLFYITTRFNSKKTSHKNRPGFLRGGCFRSGRSANFASSFLFLSASKLFGQLLLFFSFLLFSEELKKASNVFLAFRTFADSLSSCLIYAASKFTAQVSSC